MSIMKTNTNIIGRDLTHVWHPASQAQDFVQFPPLTVVSADGSQLKLQDGRIIIDAIASWWCKTLGHGHPRLKQALLQQVQQFEHVMFGSTTNETIVELSTRLTTLADHIDRVFYASDGACACEIAIKMSIHAQRICGQQQRCQLLALANAYHGETGLALSVSDIDIYKQPYKNLLPEMVFLREIPYVTDSNDPLWQDCAAIWPAVAAKLDQHVESLAAIIVEPIVQAAGGMLIYSQDFLRRLFRWAKAHDVYFIVDEIMTGIGRTGLPLACQYAAIQPDFICLGKGLTSGWLPLSAVLTTNDIYQLFYDDYTAGKSFLHSHTYSGNALAAAVAVACLQVMEDENIYAKVRENAAYLRSLMQTVAEETGKLKNVRSIGAMVAADLITTIPRPRLGYAVFKQAVALGALLRPLGNTIYWTPPLTMEREQLQQLQRITQQAIIEVTG